MVALTRLRAKRIEEASKICTPQRIEAALASKCVRVTRQLARAIQAYTGKNLNLVLCPPRIRPQSVRQRRHTIADEVARGSTHCHPQRINQRRQTVGCQVDIPNPEPVQQHRESVAIQVDIPNPEPVQQRHELVAIQVDIPNPEPVQRHENPEIWCICRGEEHGEMILCENPLCVIQWFHMDCLGMETAPDGKWYCANCQLVNKRF